MAALSTLFAFLAVCGLGAAVITGSGRALVFGLIDSAIGLVAFCTWAWSL